MRGGTLSASRGAETERDETAEGRPPGAASRVGFFLLVVSVTLLAWYALTRWGGLPGFLLPSPQAVGDRFLDSLQDGSLLRHTLVTLSEVLAGLALGVVAGASLGYGLAKSPRAERLVSPYIIASQAIPIVAIAPLLIIWLGPGRPSKILISALIVFFPILISTIAGIRSVPHDLRDLMRSLRATRGQTLRQLEIPAAAPFFLGGLKIGSTLAVIGAVVGEFVGADEGLGFLVNLGRGLYDTALVFAALLVLIAMALGLYSLAALIERRALSWRGTEKDH
jgi:NitT/TauT family transport system permease protein